MEARRSRLGPARGTSSASGDEGGDGQRHLVAAHERGRVPLGPRVRPVAPPAAVATAGAPPREPRMVCMAAIGTWRPTSAGSCGPDSGSIAGCRSPRRRVRRRPGGPRHWQQIRSRNRPEGPIPRPSSSPWAATAQRRDRPARGRQARPRRSSPSEETARDLPQATRDRRQTGGHGELDPDDASEDAGESAALTTSTAAKGRMRTPASSGDKPRSNCKNCVSKNSAPSSPKVPRHSAAAAMEKRRSEKKPRFNMGW